MTHEREDFQKFKSVTDFFRYMMRCFHHHTRNKAEEYNVERYATMFEANHEELSKVAFEGLSKENQQIVWEKVSLIKRLGEGFYNHHIRVGILVEEEVFVLQMDQILPVRTSRPRLSTSFGLLVDLNSGAGSNIIEYLKSKKGGDKFAILCILEQVESLMASWRLLKSCVLRQYNQQDDTKLLQRSTIQLLQIASSHDFLLN
ncbi:hypothetical protein BSL78_03447 [Apostichopus japonicus]|uniref:Uncharacterized protein n=1 Tax=Stichopus japonicus TaxID=307972 RepID=A0A2G8LHD6_STIJA|nr:hypothetical protein BSL78_03447 [Apostichopus japonicus]